MQYSNDDADAAERGKLFIMHVNITQYNNYT